MCLHFMSSWSDACLRAVQGSRLAACLHEISVIGMSRAEGSSAAVLLCPSKSDTACFIAFVRQGAATAS